MGVAIRSGAERAAADHVQALMSASRLRHCDDKKPGITRKRAGHGWAYFLPSGERIKDRDEIDRLNRIALPPAYVDAWFCPYANGHIQATGVDAKGRKQYRYHPDFRAQQEADKYERCADFGRALPKLRARVTADLAGRKLARDTVVAAVVRLLDLGHIRVGNEAYAKQNKSFGATTLRNRHARVSGSRLRLEYVGKSGKKQRLTIEDRRLATLVRRMQDLPGQHLFEYLDSEGQPHPVGSADVNAYLHEIAGEAFTAKDFRTWAGTLAAAKALAMQPAPAGEREAKTAVTLCVKATSGLLGNTPAVCRKAYIHPEVLTAFADKRLPKAFAKAEGPKFEAAMLKFLDALAAEVKAKK